MAGEHAGMSIIEKLWEQAGAQYGKLMELHAATGGVTAAELLGLDPDTAEEFAKGAVAYLQTQGKLQGICYALAVMLSPYDVDLDGVKAQVRKQWTALQDDTEEE